MKTRKMIILAVAAFTVVAAGKEVKAAGSATDDFVVSTTVNNSCRITSPAADMVFTTDYDPTDPTANDSGANSFAFRCVKNTAYDVYLVRPANMTDGTDLLSFDLFQDSGRTSAWSSGSPGLTGTAVSNAAIPMDIYGRIVPLQDVQAGNYSATVTITVSY